MAKRPAQESLETTADSPASKKARVQDAVGGNGASLPPPPPESNGHDVGHNSDRDTDGAESPEQQAEVEQTTLTDDESEEELEDDGGKNAKATSTNALPQPVVAGLYLDTIARKRLDFDFEKLCSVTLSNVNVYACLVCGKYYSGRGPNTQAYFHSLDEDHHVYVNMETLRVYVLPDGYEVMDKSLDDIKFVIAPRFTHDEAKALDKGPTPVAWDLEGKRYLPGYVGINNIKANDYFNVIIQMLSHITPLRNFLMLEDLSAKPELLKRFSILVRKIWNSRNFKSHVSPHELIQDVSARSNKRYQINQQADPADFLNWFLNNLHLAMGGSKTKPKSSLIQKIFQGSLKVESQDITARADIGDRLRFEDADVKSSTTPFMLLTLDLPPAPLFQNDRQKDTIPQVPLVEILKKYNGLTAQERMNTRVRYRLLHPLPPFLIMHVKRFLPNKFLQMQHNPTIVTFNPQNLDMSPYVEPNPSLHTSSEPIVYDLVACVTHEAVKVRDDSVEGEVAKKVWKAQVKERGGGQEWWELQDLYVDNLHAELLSTREVYLMVWERRKTKGKGKAK